MRSPPQKTQKDSSFPSISIRKILTTPLQHTLLKWNGEIFLSGTMNKTEAIGLPKTASLSSFFPLYLSFEFLGLSVLFSPTCHDIRSIRL
jgi:hypothetical protein